MDKNTLWSLRLGYTNQQAAQIEKLGIALFLKQSFDAKFETALPSFLDDDPKTLADLKALRESIKTNDNEQQHVHPDLARQRGVWPDVAQPQRQHGTSHAGKQRRQNG